MPLIKNRSIPLQPVPLISLKKSPGIPKNTPVWVIQETGEIFTNYSDFCYKVLLYRKKIWTCQWTDKSGLTYYQAINSEFDTEAEILQSLNKTLRDQVLGLVFDGPDYIKLLAELVHQELHGTLKVGDRVTWIESKAGAQGKILDIQIQNKNNPAENKCIIQTDSNLVFSVLIDHLKKSAPYLTKMNIPNILQFIKKCSKDTILKKYFAENKHLESLNNNAAKSSYRADYLSKLNANTALSKEKRGIPTFVIDSANFSERDTNYSGTPEPYMKEDSPVDRNGHNNVHFQRILPAPSGFTPNSNISSPKTSNISIGKFRGLEDLTIRTNPQKQCRPDFKPVPIADPELLSITAKIWVFTNTFHESLDFDQLPLFNIIELIDQSISVESENRFEIEYLIMAYLNLVVPDAFVFANQWLPLDSASPTTSVEFLTTHLGDWRKAQIPLKPNTWGRALFGCLKQLATDVGLSNAQAILSHLEGSEDAPNAIELTSDIEELVKTNMEDGVTSNKKTRGNKGKAINDPATELETDFQTRFYRLCSTDKLKILSFLVEQASGSTKIRNSIENRVDERTNLKRDKAELQKQIRSRVEELTMINRNIQEIETSLSPYLDVQSSSPVSSPNSLNNGKRPAEDSAQPQQLTRLETKTMRKKLDELKTSQRDVVCINEQNDDRLDRLENQINMQFDLLRFKPVGQDRFLNKYYFAFGCVSLPDSEDGPKILVEHCVDIATLSQLSSINKDELASRWKSELGMDAEPHPKAWGYLDSLDQVKKLIEWLNPNGLREKVLKNGLDAVLDAFEDEKEDEKEDNDTKLKSEN